MGTPRYSTALSINHHQSIINTSPPLVTQVQIHIVFLGCTPTTAAATPTTVASAPRGLAKPSACPSPGSGGRTGATTRWWCIPVTDVRVVLGNAGPRATRACPCSWLGGGSSGTSTPTRTVLTVFVCSGSRGLRLRLSELLRGSVGVEGWVGAWVRDYFFFKPTGQNMQGAAHTCCTCKPYALGEGHTHDTHLSDEVDG